MDIKDIYILLIPLLLYFIIKIPLNKYPSEWKYKILFLYFTLFIFWINIVKNIEIINNYIIPSLLFINVLILIYFTINKKINIINLLRLLGIIYLLFTFNFNDFRATRGSLFKLNEINIKWTISYVVILSLWFLLENDGFFDSKEKFYSIIILFLPFLFPFKEYYLHRMFILVLGITMKYLIK